MKALLEIKRDESKLTGRKMRMANQGNEVCLVALIVGNRLKLNCRDIAGRWLKKL